MGHIFKFFQKMGSMQAIPVRNGKPYLTRVCPLFSLWGETKWNGSGQMVVSERKNVLFSLTLHPLWVIHWSPKQSLHIGDTGSRPTPRINHTGTTPGINHTRSQISNLIFYFRFYILSTIRNTVHLFITTLYTKNILTRECFYGVGKDDISSEYFAALYI